jgi:peptidase E
MGVWERVAFEVSPHGKEVKKLAPASKAQQKAVNKYMKNNYDRVNLTLPKGKKAEVQVHADGRGESINGFIGRAIDAQMERDKAADK